MMVDWLLRRPTMEEEFIENKIAASVVLQDRQQYLENVEASIRKSLPKEKSSVTEILEKEFEEHFFFQKEHFFFQKAKLPPSNTAENVKADITPLGSK